MAIKTNQELIDAAKAIIGEDTGDAALAFLDDLADTVDDYDKKTKDATDWHQKYDENDAAWRKRYADRFSGKTEDTDDEPGKDYEKPDPPKKTYLDLFKTEE